MEQRVAMMSGASGGIGACIARKLSESGWSLSLGARDPERLAREFSGAHIFHHDATRADENEWAEEARTHFGRIDAVICSAGLMIAEDPVEITDEAFDRMLEVNVKAPRRLVSAVWPDLTAGGQGRILLLVSLSGKRVRSAGSASYAVTKHAALALCHGFRQKGWNQGVRATAICPGRVNTSMARAMTDMPPDQLTQPESVAAMVELALSLPNEASVAEMMVNCDLEDQY